MNFLAGIAQSIVGSFLAPVSFAFLGLIPVVVLLYLLKLRRTPVVISSTMLWHKSLQDLTANAPFQRLRRNLLLFLQILILLLVILALARPFIKAEGTAGNDLCLIIDRSASMQTIEKGAGPAETRLDRAKAAAFRMVDEMASGDKMMLVTFADSSDVLCELTGDRYTLRNAIRGITATDSVSKIRDAILVATSLHLSAPLLRTIVLSDGKIADLDDLGTRAVNVSFLRVGETSPDLTARNAGIVAFSVREPSEGSASSERQCLVLIANDAPEPLDTTLTLEFDDAQMAVEEVQVPAKSSHEAVFAIPDVNEGVLRAHLDIDDALAVDNTAWLAVRPPSTVRVLLVSEANSAGAYFLKRVLALNPRVELSAVAPADYTTAQGDFDITLFDNFAPPTLPPGLLVFFNALPDLPDLRADGTIENPPIIASDPDHPVMRFLNPANVTIAKALKMTLPEGGRPLISTQGGALLADVSRGGQSILVVGFDLADSNWPLRLSFPLFVQNLIAWAPKAALAAETSVASGNPLTILPAPDVQEGTVYLPDGTHEAVRLDPTRPVYFANTSKAGVYRVQTGAKSETYAVNLLDPRETAITPAESISIGRSQVAAEPARLLQNRELWHWFALAALGVLTLEWWIYSRRAWL